MIHHHIQKHILRHLITHPEAHFAELKPKNLDSNIFTYHLHQLMKDKLVVKGEDGLYRLTPHGKFATIDTQRNPYEILELAYSIILLKVQNSEGHWLLRKRLTDPLFGLWGFVHGEPNATETTPETATRVLMEKTGLTATFTPKGSGYLRVTKNGQLESFTHFTLLETDNATGKLKTSVGNGENKWITSLDFTDESMIQNTRDLLELSRTNGHFFAELSYKL